MGYFTNAVRARVAARGLKLVSQLPPDETDDGAWDGDPANVAATLQFAPLVASTAYLDRYLFLWCPRWNSESNPNYSANLLGAVFGVNGNAVLRRTHCLPFVGGASYVLGQRVYDAGTGKDYASKDIHTAAASFALDAAHWEEIAAPLSTPECRTEYNSAPKARAALRAIVDDLAGGTSAAAICAAYGLALYTHADAEAGKDAIFTEYATQLNPTQVGLPAGLGFAVARDTVVLQPYRLSDLWSAWSNGGTNDVGQIKRDEADKSFWWCAVAHTSAGSGTFAEDRAAGAAGKWKPIDIGVLFDWEVSDRTAPTIAEDTSPDADGSLQYVFEALRAMLAPEGYKMIFYTNDIGAESPVSTNNGVTETSIPHIQANVDVMQPIADGNTYLRSSFRASVVANYNRQRYVNADPTQGDRPTYAPGKVGATLEMVQRYANQSWAITNLTVGPAPTYTVTITAPGHNLPTNAQVDLLGLYDDLAVLNRRCFRVSSPSIEAGTFVVATEILSVNPMTGAIVTASFNGSGLGAYIGGGCVGTGGATVQDMIAAARFLRSKGVRWINLWRNFTEQGRAELDGPAVAISAISAANPAVVTTVIDHGLTASTFDVRGLFEGVRGLVGLNQGGYRLTPTGDRTVAIDGYNSTALPAYEGGGLLRPARRAYFNRKAAIVAEGRYVPRPIITAYG